MRSTYVDNSRLCSPLFVQCEVFINVPTNQQRSWGGSFSHQLRQWTKKKRKEKKEMVAFHRFVLFVLPFEIWAGLSFC